MNIGGIELRSLLFHRMGGKVISFMGSMLSELDLSQAARVAELTVAGSMRRRLQDLGFVPGAEVRALYAGFRGGIRAYSVGGSVIALRRDDAAHVLIKQ